MKHTLLARAMTGALALTALHGCSSSDDEPAPTPDPVITDFFLTGNEVPIGGTVNITWDVLVGDRIEISQTGYPVFSSTDLSGTRTSEPINEDTQFVLTAFNGEKMLASMPLSVAARGIRIADFRVTPDSIEEGGSATLTWQITDGTPNVVRIEDDAGNEIYEGTDLTGSEEVSPLVDTTYTLTAIGATRQTATVTLRVTVNMDPPVITSFSANPTVVVRGQQRTTLDWTVENTEQVEITANVNGVRRVVRPASDVGIPRGNFRPLVNDPSVNFILKAINQSRVTATATVTVTSQVGPTISSLTVDPVGFTQASTVATVMWQTINANAVGLTVNGIAVPAFPADALDGTFQVDVSGNSVLQLTATNEVSSIQASVSVSETFAEREPNDTLEQAISYQTNGGAVRGTIDPLDVDWYRFEITEDDSMLFISAGWTLLGGCGLDSLIRVYDSTGTEIGAADDAFWPDYQSCAQVHPAYLSWARDLAPGTYYASVSGTGNQPTGPYHFNVRAAGPDDALPPNTVITPLGTPQWGIRDLKMFSIEAQNTLLDTVDRMVQNGHGLDGLFDGSVTPILAHLTPHILPYERELAAFRLVSGYEAQSTFAPGDLDATHAVTLAYTLVPTSTVTGSSPDYGLPGPVFGPIIPNILFPITIQLQVQRNDMGWQGPDTPIGYPGYAAWPMGGAYGPPANPGDGSSHRHVIHLATEAASGEAPMPGTYRFLVTLQDASGAGYALNVPFTVQ